MDVNDEKSRFRKLAARMNYEVTQKRIFDFTLAFDFAFIRLKVWRTLTSKEHRLPRKKERKKEKT